MTEAAPAPELLERVASALGAQPVRWHTPHTGLSAARRFVLRFADGSGAFVKAAVDDATEGWLRNEHEILTRVEGPFLPRVLAWLEAGGRPALVIEDLSGAHWPADHLPVSWRAGQRDLLFATLERVAAAAPPDSLPAAEADFEPRWPEIAREVEGFLALGLCSETWFRGAIDGLVEAERAVPLAGSCLVHNDVRSDNLCFLGHRMVLVDWGGALRGHPHHDLAAVLTTLPLEGGPDPFDVLPEGGPWAAWHAGRSAWRAGLPAAGLAGATRAPEWFRRVLLRIAAICLAWAARSLDLPPFRGPHWTEIP